MAATELLFDGPQDSSRTLVLAHGAGAPMDSGFMNRIARAVGERGIRVARFEFPYMRRRREGQKSGAPDRPAVLLDSWRSVVAQLGGGARLVIGGKSMGGRIASMVADELGAAGLVCLGYPFHPPGRPDKLRTAHLEELSTPALFLQGTRDPFGTRDEVPAYPLSAAIRVHWLEDGDHSLVPRKSSGRSESQNLEEAIGAIVDFVASR
jgi:hypothetical protein